MALRKRQIALAFSSEMFLGWFSTEIDDLGLILDDQAHPPNMTIRKRHLFWLFFSSEIFADYGRRPKMARGAVISCLLD